MRRERALEELDKLEQEVRRRNRERQLELYVPHEKQITFHSSLAHTRLLEGGNRSGKSTAGITEDLAHALGYRPWDGSKIDVTLPSKGIIYAPDFENNHKRTTIPKIEDFCPPSKILKVVRGQAGIKEYWIDSGVGISKIFLGTYKGFKQDPQSAESADWDWIHWDEPPPRDLWIAATRGLIDRDGREWFTMTPLREPWIYDEIKLKEGEPGKSIFVMNMDMDDNPHLTEHAKNEYLDKLSPEEREARKGGKWMHLSGVVYKDFNRDVHVVPRSVVQLNWPRGCVIDPHLRRPFAIGWFAVGPANDIYFYDEWPNQRFHEIKSYTNIVEEYAKLIKEREQSHDIEDRDFFLWRVLDPNFGRTPNPITGETLEDEFGKYGLHFDTRVSDDIEAGHLAVQTMLRYNADEPVSSFNRPKMYFTENCENFILGMEHYQWDEWKGGQDKAWKEKPKDKFKDFPDLVRYATMYQPAFAGMEIISHNDSDEEYDGRGVSGYGF